MTALQTGDAWYVDEPPGRRRDVVAGAPGGDDGDLSRLPALLAWSIKEAFHEPLPLWVFIATGIWAVAGGTVRAHLLFTSAINPSRLKDEHLRVRRTLTAVDLLIAAALAVDGLSIASIRPLWGVLTVGLAAGIALATLLMEPATAAATFQSNDCRRDHAARRTGRPGGGRTADAFAGPGEVLIKVAAAGVNRPDVMQRMGHYPPPPGASDIPGLEVAGTIVEVGADAGEWRTGDRVCALVAGGGYAEYCVAPAPQCLPVPRGMDFVHAAAIPETFFTVWTNVFERGRLQAGRVDADSRRDRAASARRRSSSRAHVGRACSPRPGSADKCAACERLGAERAINYRETDFVAAIREATDGRGVDVVLDMVGGDYLPRNLDVLAMDGRLVQIAVLGGEKAHAQPDRDDAAPADADRFDAAGAADRGKGRDRRRSCTRTSGRCSKRARSAGDSRDVSAALRGRRAPRDGIGRAHRQARARRLARCAAQADVLLQGGSSASCGTIDDS